MAMAIDLDRGVLIRKVRNANMKIFMYLDTPGEYFNVHGKEVPIQLASAAGFETEKYAKEKYKRDKMAEFRYKMEQELDIEAEGAPAKVLAERAGYKVVETALGYANVFDPDGLKLNERPITEAEAKLLLDFMAPPVEEPVKVKGKTKTAKDVAAEAALAEVIPEE